MLDLKEELKGILGAGRAARLSMRLYGFDGRGGTTLRQLANETGLSHERIRQLSNHLIRARTATRPVTPALDRAIQMIAAHAPASADGIERQLARCGHRRRAFRLEGVINAARVFGRPAPFSLARNVSGRVVYMPSPVDSMQVMRAAKEHLKVWGMARIGDVAASVRSKRPISLDDVISALLESREDFRWLNQGLGWFWLSQFGRNKVANRLTKILAVSSSVSLREAYAAIAKDYRIPSFGPPLSVFGEFCRQVPGIQLGQNGVITWDQTDRRQVLSSKEQKIINIIDRQGAQITWKELVKACGEVGLSTGTASVFVTTSPLVRKRSRGVYSLIGRTTKDLGSIRDRALRGAKAAKREAC
jgi:hypothetical protein